MQKVKIINKDCFNGSILRISGMRSEEAMHMNPPAVRDNKKITNRCKYIERRYPITPPRTADKAVKKFKIKAFFFLKPPKRNMPKSPISCGTSWKDIARVVTIPKPTLLIELAAMARLSIKL